jgi:glycosyltransferase involved in cell wall biosynthesis
MEEFDLSKNPLVSICMPAYNAEKYISEAIQSVIDQTYSNWELIIVNDGSTDDTAVIAASFIDKRIQLIKINNSGAAAARNTAYKISKGKYIKFLDSDDLINPEMIAEQVKLATTNNNCIVSGKWGRFYNDDINTFKLSPEECWQTLPPVGWICSSWKNGNSMTNPGIFFIPKMIIEKTDLWDENLSLLDDMEYFTRTILESDSVVFSNNSTLYYRSGINGSLSDTKSRKGYESAFTAIEKATNALLAKHHDSEVQLTCANIWQSFIYDAYPGHMDLMNKALAHLNNLPKPTLSFPSGGYTKLLNNLLGWKVTKRTKHFLNI